MMASQPVCRRYAADRVSPRLSSALRPLPGPSTAMPRRNLTGTLRRYLLVTKPGIVCGNLIAAAGGFILASRGQADMGRLFFTVLAISLAVASGCVFNNWLDRDLDRRMKRTRNRILARGLMTGRAAVLYGLMLGATGLVLLAVFANQLSMFIVLAGLAVYVGLYTLLLKRRSRFAVLVGSLAGAAPPLAGYCAAANRFDLGALLLLLLFTLWQVPHSLAIAIFRLGDYHAAAIPVLPVSRGVATARKQLLVSIAAFAAVSLLPTFCGYTGYCYLAVALGVGLSWLLLAWWGFGAKGNDVPWARRLFVFSIVGILVLSFMLAVDPTRTPAERLARVGQRIKYDSLLRENGSPHDLQKGKPLTLNDSTWPRPAGSGWGCDRAKTRPL